MRILLVLSLLISAFPGRPSVPASTEALLDELFSAIDSVEFYTARKEAELDSLKSGLPAPGADGRCAALLSIGDAYSKYSADSSLYYFEAARLAAAVAGDRQGEAAATLGKANILVFAGYYMESWDVLKDVCASGLDRRNLASYYLVKATLYHNLYNSDDEKEEFSGKYRTEYAIYRDSLLMVADSASDDYMRNVERKLARAGDYGQAREMNTRRLESVGAHGDLYQQALAFYDRFLIGYRYEGRRTEEDIDFLLKSAIVDVRSVNQEVASLLYVESYLSSIGEVRRAKRVADYYYSTMRKFGSRKSWLSGMELSMNINEEHSRQLAVQKRQLTWALTSLSVLLVVLVLLFFYVSASRKKITDLNLRLSKSNKVSTSYVVGFFHLYSSYIDRLLVFRNRINSNLRKGNTQYLIELTNPSRDITNEELREMYRNFDSAFLDIFPGYVAKFQDCLRPECRTRLKSGELLDAEMRIFALIKLGVDDSSRIAELLHYSIKTVYNKRSSIKSKLAVPQEKFYRILTEI